MRVLLRKRKEELPAPEHSVFVSMSQCASFFHTKNEELAYAILSLKCLPAGPCRCKTTSYRHTFSTLKPKISGKSPCFQQMFHIPFALCISFTVQVPSTLEAAASSSVHACQTACSYCTALGPSQGPDSHPSQACPRAWQLGGLPKKLSQRGVPGV